MLEKSFSELNLLLISIPKSMTESTDEMIQLLIFKSYFFPFLSQIKIIAWTLSGFTIISFILNQSVAELFCFSNIFSNKVSNKVSKRVFLYYSWLHILYCHLQICKFNVFNKQKHVIYEVVIE